MKIFTRFPSPITAVRSLRLLMPWQNLSVTCKRLTFDHLSWHGWLESHWTLREILDEQLACYITSSGGAWHVLIGHRYCARKTFDEADFIKMRERKKNRQTDGRTEALSERTQATVGDELQKHHRRREWCLFNTMSSFSLSFFTLW